MLRKPCADGSERLVPAKPTTTSERMRWPREVQQKNVTFTDAAKAGLNTLFGAVTEVLRLATEAFVNSDCQQALRVEPLEQVIDELTKILRTHSYYYKAEEC